MSERKIKVNYTLDPDVVEAVEAQAKQLSDRTGVKVSASALVNKTLKKVLVKGQNK